MDETKIIVTTFFWSAWGQSVSFVQTSWVLDVGCAGINHHPALGSPLQPASVVGDHHRQHSSTLSPAHFNNRKPQNEEKKTPDKTQRLPANSVAAKQNLPP
jgi:hypothetical protein